MLPMFRRPVRPGIMPRRPDDKLDALDRLQTPTQGHNATMPVFHCSVASVIRNTQPVREQRATQRRHLAMDAPDCDWDGAPAVLTLESGVMNGIMGMGANVTTGGAARAGGTAAAVGAAGVVAAMSARLNFHATNALNNNELS